VGADVLAFVEADGAARRRRRGLGELGAAGDADVVRHLEGSESHGTCGCNSWGSVRAAGMVGSPTGGLLLSAAGPADGSRVGCPASRAIPKRRQVAALHSAGLILWALGWGGRPAPILLS